MTAELVFVGFGSRDLVRRIVGVWVAMFLYRRPLLAIFDACFAWCREDGADILQITQLSSEVLTELLEAALLAPFAETDVRAPVAPRLHASDASPYGAGAVVAEIPEAAARELWRHRDRREPMCGSSGPRR